LVGDFNGEDEMIINPMPGSLTRVFFGFEMKKGKYCSRCALWCCYIDLFNN